MGSTLIIWPAGGGIFTVTEASCVDFGNLRQVGVLGAICKAGRSRQQPVTPNQQKHSFVEVSHLLSVLGADIFYGCKYP
ncbi:hypothetical protein AMELA_G00159080 [Ameiurus melas]|uniref:Uncharacterized protein n=1 Tax=Ameiurus melas TaxID=219545 RepID=A0A7J6AIE0_AMEME|nr:hypothetical protein AMELA_G00159080 [Ameiurus melas]